MKYSAKCSNCGADVAYDAKISTAGPRADLIVDWPCECGAMEIDFDGFHLLGVDNCREYTVEVVSEETKNRRNI